MGLELPAGWPHTSQGAGFAPAPRRIWWSDERRQKFEQMWRDNVDVGEIADHFEISEGNVYTKAGQWHLGRRRRRGGEGKATAKRKARKPRKLPDYDSSSQRRFTGVSKGNGPKVVLQPHDPRYRAGITIFPTTVKPAAAIARLLKSGHNSRKIGKIFTKGHWKHMPIFTLTLEERATCPPTCLEWATCYGNNMPFADRIFDDGTLTRRLWGELAALAAEFPAGFVVRLHVLGDFFSRDYVSFWADALHDFPPLRIFGFTARRPNDPIGADLVHLTAAKPDRFVMRFSGAGYDENCSEVVDKAGEATGIVCPAELDGKRSCATCGLCPSSNKSITFIRH